MLSQNSYRLGNLQGIQALFDLTRREDPDILFIQKTKLNYRDFKKMNYRLKFDQGLGVECEGKSGRLALLWKEEIGLSIHSFSKHHIHATIKTYLNQHWCLTGVYGHPKASTRGQVWNLLKYLCLSDGMPWIFFCDFNEILQDDEK